MEQFLQIIIEKLKNSQANFGLLRGKMGIALFFFQYARSMNYPYEEEYANQLIDKIIEELENIEHSGYATGLAGIGAGIEYLAQQGFINENTNNILSDFDKVIHRVVSHLQNFSIDTRNGITGYGKYYLARMSNPTNYGKTNSSVEIIKTQLIKIVDLLSASYGGYAGIYSVIDFLPDVIDLGINKEKAVIYLNYAIDILETTVYEDVFSGKFPIAFNPLIAAALLFRAAGKTGNSDLRVRALDFLERYEVDYRQYLSEKQAIQWAFLYQFLWEACDSSVYKELSNQWLEKITDDSFNLELGDLIISGMMLLSMNKRIEDEWLSWFPIY